MLYIHLEYVRRERPDVDPLFHPSISTGISVTVSCSPSLPSAERLHVFIGLRLVYYSVSQRLTSAFVVVYTSLTWAHYPVVIRLAQFAFCPQIGQGLKIRDAESLRSSSTISSKSALHRSRKDGIHWLIRGGISGYSICVQVLLLPLPALQLICIFDTSIYHSEYRRLSSRSPVLRHTLS